jgi:GTP diphosphokinase / guanosine-3',5'-bis(diphosphate) 3'-diphosphatase
MNDIGLIVRAAVFAEKVHRGQTRKGAESHPYISHPLTVAQILTVEGGVTDAATIAAALLHDVVEDCGTLPAELEAVFGSEVRSIVEEVTDDKSLPKADRKRLQVEHAAHISRKAQLVKLADKIANIRDVASSPPDWWDMARRQAYFDWGKQVVDQLRGAHPGLEAVFDEAYKAKPT